MFKSGLNETVSFFPIEVIDLKSGERIKALQLDMFINYLKGIAFIGPFV